MKKYAPPSASPGWAAPSAISSWHVLVQRIDAVRGISSLRTLAGLGTWKHRWMFSQAAIEDRLGVPYRGGLTPSETSARVTREGYRFEPRNGTADREVLSPFHEVQTRSLVSRYVARAWGGVFVDVGAHCGSFSIPYESFFERVISIEPLPDNYAALRRNIALNKLERKVRGFNLAAGARAATGTLFLNGDEMSSLVPMATSAGTVAVTIRPVDDLLSDERVSAAEVRLLKADVEGAELDVLEGAQRLISDGSPLVVLEANTPRTRIDLETYMRRFGYVLVRAADGRNLFFQRPDERSLPPVLAFGIRFASLAHPSLRGIRR
jgi:FkbM family methyltransferase